MSGRNVVAVAVTAGAANDPRHPALVRAQARRPLLNTLARDPRLATREILMHWGNLITVILFAVDPKRCIAWVLIAIAIHMGVGS